MWPVQVTQQVWGPGLGSAFETCWCVQWPKRGADLVLLPLPDHSRIFLPPPPPPRPGEGSNTKSKSASLPSLGGLGSGLGFLFRCLISVVVETG